MRKENKLCNQCNQCYAVRITNTILHSDPDPGSGPKGSDRDRWNKDLNMKSHRM